MGKKRAAWARGSFVLAMFLVLASCSDKSDRSLSEQKGVSEPIVIEPKVGVGNVRAGMRVQQVVAELGEPQRRTANALEYTRLGFAVLSDSNGVVKVVMCGDVTGINGPLVKSFAGRTKEGIGMHSTREDVVKVYGEPTESEKFRGGLESLKYQPLGITFTLEGGKVHHMIVRLAGSQETNRTVTLEPAQK